MAEAQAEREEAAKQRREAAEERATFQTTIAAVERRAQA